MTKKLKKPVSILLALVMLFGVLAVAPFTVSAAATEYTTTTGGTYSFDPETGELHLISGEFTGKPWNSIRNQVKSVTTEKTGVSFNGSCSQMFSGFTKCTSIDLSGVDTTTVWNMGQMFMGCTSLTEVDLSSFTINKTSSGNPIDTGAMFFYATNIEKLTISGKFTGGVIYDMNLNIGKIEDPGWIRSDSETGEIVSGSRDAAILAAPDDANSTVTYIWIASTVNYTLEQCEDDTGKYNLHLISGFFRKASWRAADFENIGGKGNVKFVTADEGVKFTSSCAELFRDFRGCESMNLCKADASNVINTSGMFWECRSLKNLDLPNFKTQPLTNISTMFYYCTALEVLDLSCLKISEDATRGACFLGTGNLKELTISGDFDGGITSNMELNNGENSFNGWRDKADPTAAKVSESGDEEGTAKITNTDYLPGEGETKTYIWIGYWDVDWKNWDGTKLVKTEQYKAETNIHPTYKGVAPTKPESGGKTYEFSGWTDGENTYGLTDDLPYVTKDTTYTAVFTEAPVKYFVGNSLSLEGDIGVNFVIDMHDVLPQNATVKLSWYKYSEDFDVSKLRTKTSGGKTYYLATARVAAKEMADTITAELYEGNTLLDETTYSVKAYADKIINTADLSTLGITEKKTELKNLCKAMLKYGSASEAQFDPQYPEHVAAHTVDGVVISATDGISYSGYTPAAIPSYTMPDYSSVFSDYGMEYYASAIGTKTTTYYKIAFKAPKSTSNPPDMKYDGKTIAPDTTSGTNVAIYEFKDIYVNDITDDIEVTVDGKNVKFNMLAYITSAMNNGDTTIKNTVSALYDYGAKAKTYFG